MELWVSRNYHTDDCNCPPDDDGPRLWEVRPFKRETAGGCIMYEGGDMNHPIHLTMSQVYGDLQPSECLPAKIKIVRSLT